MEATVTVTAVDSVGPDTLSIRLDAPPGFAAAPGQFVALEATVDGEDYRRFYTLSSPRVEGTFEVTVGVDDEAGGPFTDRLVALDPGDELGMSGPFGKNHYEGETRVVVLAGGPGVGAAVAVAERALDDGGEAAVVYRDDAPAHGARLDALRDRGASVVVTDGPVGAAVADAVTGAPDERVFVYGFQPFVDEALAALEGAGVDPDDAKVESFG
jgi:ferredoxin-NADP reductase